MVHPQSNQPSFFELLRILMLRIVKQVSSLRALILRKPTLIILIRHAESARNKIKGGKRYFTVEHAEARQLIRGLSDRSIPITEKGKRQAELTGHYLREQFGRPHAIYHSGYRRTKETLQAILGSWTDREQAKIQIASSNLLREREVGYTWDLTEEEVRRHFPYYEEYLKIFGEYDAAPPGGESLANVAERLDNFIDSHFELEAGRKIFIVCHGGIIKCFRSILEKWDPDNWPDIDDPEDCGITVYRYEILTNRLRLVEYNTTAWKEELLNKEEKTRGRQN